MIEWFFLQKVANETMEIVSKEETAATAKAKETQAIADDAQRDLDEALPALVSVLNISKHLACFP